jgi:putative transposase
MHLADIVPIYPLKQLTVLGEKKYIHPYLLKNLQIERPNQVCEIIITYVPMKDGLIYLTAIIDVFSRKIVSWVLSNSLDAESSLRVVRNGIETSGKPEILNSEQGSQFACLEYINLLKRENTDFYGW